MRNPLVPTALLMAFALPAWAAVNHGVAAPAAQQPPTKPKWLLKAFIQVSDKDPRRLIEMGENLFSDERLRVSTIEPSLAYEWQHRLAMVSALSDMFDPTPGKGKKTAAVFRNQARAIITKALAQDPSLLVRDGAVESVRRIVRMQPGERGLWKKPLEQAFLSPRNILDGEGFFIRETILTTLKEASLRPSKKIHDAALRDKNPQVRQLLKAWRTQAYDEL